MQTPLLPPLLLPIGLGLPDHDVWQPVTLRWPCGHTDQSWRSFWIRHQQRCRCLLLGKNYYACSYLKQPDLAAHHCFLLYAHLHSHELQLRGAFVQAEKHTWPRGCIHAELHQRMRHSPASVWAAWYVHTARETRICGAIELAKFADVFVTLALPNGMRNVVLQKLFPDRPGHVFVSLLNNCPDSMWPSAWSSQHVAAILHVSSRIV